MVVACWRHMLSSCSQCELLFITEAGYVSMPRFCSSDPDSKGPVTLQTNTRQTSLMGAVIKIVQEHQSLIGRVLFSAANKRLLHVWM